MFTLNELITIGIPCAPGAEEFARFAISTARKTALNSNRLHFHLAIPENCERNSYDSLAKEYNCHISTVDITGLPDGRMKNGLAHCRGLQILYQSFETKLAILCDNDAAFLDHGWDRRLVNLLSETVVIVGTAYPQTPVEHLALPQGVAKPIFKYQRFPNVIACLFDVASMRQAGIDFLRHEQMAEKNGFMPILLDDPELTRLAGVPDGAFWLLDTGFDLPVRVRKAGRDGLALPLQSMTESGLLAHDLPRRMTDGTVLPGGSEVYCLGQRPMFSHFGKASRRSFQSKEAQSWVDAVERWIGDETRWKLASEGTQ